MADFMSSFTTGFNAGNKIRSGWEERDLKERQFRALQEHQKFQEDLQRKQQVLQERQNDVQLLDRIRQVMTDQTLHPQAKSFLLDDIARQRGQDPKSEYYQGLKKVITTMPADQARALTSALIGAYPEMPSGSIGHIVDGLLTGGIPVASIPKLVGELNQLGEAARTRQQAAQVYGDQPSPQPGTPQPGAEGAAPLQSTAAPQPGPAGWDEPFSVDQLAGQGPAGTQLGAGPAGPKAGTGNMPAMMDQPLSPAPNGMTGNADFSGAAPGYDASPSQSADFGAIADTAPRGTSLDAGGVSPQIAGPVGYAQQRVNDASGTSNADIASRQPTMGEVFSGGRGIQPALPTPGKTPTLGDIMPAAAQPTEQMQSAGGEAAPSGEVAQAAESRNPVIAALQRTIQARQSGDRESERLHRAEAIKEINAHKGDMTPDELRMVATLAKQAGAPDSFSNSVMQLAQRRETGTAGPAKAPAPVDPKKDPQFWLDAAAKFETMGPQYAEYAKQAREQAKALETASKTSSEVRAANQKASGAMADDRAKVESAAVGIDKTIGMIDELRIHPGMFQVAGRVPFGGDFTAFGHGLTYADLFPGTHGAEFFNKHKTLISNVALEAMQELKAMSSQGATGFGALSQKELAVLENSAGALQLTNKPETLIKAYDKFRDQLVAARSRLQDRFEEKYNAKLKLSPVPEKSSANNIQYTGEGPQWGPPVGDLPGLDLLPGTTRYKKRLTHPDQMQ